MTMRTSKGRFAGLLFLVVLSLVFVAGSVSAEQFMYSGTVLNDCASYATVTIAAYETGHINDPAHLNDTISVTTDVVGAFAGISNNINHATYDINISVSNPSCDPTASGSVALLAQATDALPNPPKMLTQDVTLNAQFYAQSPADDATVFNNQTSFDWANGYLGVTFNLVIANDSGFTLVEHNITGIGVSSYTLSVAEELADGQYYWYVEAVNGSGTVIDTTADFTFTIAAAGYNIIDVSPANNSWSGSLSVPINITTNDVAQCRWATTSGVAFASKQSFTSTGTSALHQMTFSLASEGANRLYVQCDSDGSVGDEVLFVWRRDTTPPSTSSASVSIESDSSYSLDTILDFTWSGFTDGGSGLAGYYYNTSSNGGSTNGFFDTSSPGQLTTTQQGTNTVYVWAVDAVGNIGSVASDSIIVDNLPPSFSSWSSDPASLNMYTTGEYIVYVTITETSAFSGSPQFRYRIGSDSWSSWSPLTFISSAGSAIEYRFSIPEGSSPNTWFERSGEDLTYEVSATDTHMFSNSVSRSELISDQVNAPSIDPISNKVVDEEATLVFNLSGSDADSAQLTYSCNMSSASYARVNDTVVTVSWTPPIDYYGRDTYTCNVTDGMFTTATSFVITVFNVNDDPVLDEVGNLYAQEYEFFNYSLNASDVDDDVLIFSSNSSLFSLNRLTGKIAFTPFSAQRGVYNINLTVEDGKGGLDYQSLVFTVGYCGDGVCRSGYEDCSSCELDCGVCGDETGQAIIVDSRNCLGKSMMLHAVELVPRATCTVEGAIIDGKEACDDLTNANVLVHIFVDDLDSWEQVASLVTDEFGLASFTPEEIGRYRASFSGGEDVVFFEIDQCSGLSTDDGSSTQNPSAPSEPSKPSGPVEPPVIEEPSEVQDALSGRFSFVSLLLYFVFLPILLISAVISGLGYAYRFEKKRKKQSGFVKWWEQVLKEWLDFKVKFNKWLDENPQVKKWLATFGKTAQEVRKYVSYTQDIIVDQWYQLTVLLGMKRSLKTPYYDIDMHGKRKHLLLLSLLKNVFPKRSVDELLGLIYEYEIGSLYDVAAMLMSFDVKVQLVDTNPDQVQYLNALVGRGLLFRSKATTRVDIESSLQSGLPVVALFSELGENNSIVQRTVLLCAFDKEFFYYHDYDHKRKDVAIKKGEFIKGVRAAGNKVLLVRK